MTTAYETAAETARQAANGGPADELLERMAELIGAKASVSAVFGEPIRHGDLTVVPVARVRWGFGGGGGRRDDTATGAASGSGGGGGVAADPLGYLQVTAGEAMFRPIRDRYPSPVFLIAAGVTAAIILRALARFAGR